MGVSFNLNEFLVLLESEFLLSKLRTIKFEIQQSGRSPGLRQKEPQFQAVTPLAIVGLETCIWRWTSVPYLIDVFVELGTC